MTSKPQAIRLEFVQEETGRRSDPRSAGDARCSWHGGTIIISILITTTFQAAARGLITRTCLNKFFLGLPAERAHR